PPGSEALRAAGGARVDRQVPYMISVAIAGTGSALPRRVIPTRRLVEEAFAGVDPESLARTEARTGIATRHWLEPGETAAGLATEAVKLALERAGMEAGAL